LSFFARFPLAFLFLTLFWRDGWTVVASPGTGTWNCAASHAVGSVVVGSVIVGPVAWTSQGTTTWTSAPAAVTLRVGDVAWTSRALGDAAAMLILERGMGVSHRAGLGRLGLEWGDNGLSDVFNGLHHSIIETVIPSQPSLDILTSYKCSCTSFF